MNNYTSPWTRTLLAAFVLALRAGAANGQSTDQIYKIEKIEFTGLHSYSREQAVEALGLKEGAQVKLDDLQASANKLLSSGLFKKASYHYLYQGDNLQVTLDVEEQRTNVPVVFDNFVWLSDSERTAGGPSQQIPLVLETRSRLGLRRVCRGRLRQEGFTASIGAIVRQTAQRKHQAGPVERNCRRPGRSWKLRVFELTLAQATLPSTNRKRPGSFLSDQSYPRNIFHTSTISLPRQQ